MLKVVGVENLDDLFLKIPKECQRENPLNLPETLTEWELNDFIGSLAGFMATSPEYNIFTGAGSYEHYIPATIPYLLARSEFITAYTPYQPEVSQGTLQGIFEYQTLGISITDVISLFHMPQPDYIKIDVDGMEHFILRGGRSILNNVKGVLVEINDTFEDQAEESFQILKNAGLSLHRKCDIGDPNQFNQWWIRSTS